MKCKTIVLWWLVSGKVHRQLEAGDCTIASLIPLVQALFPGINYYSSTGFNQVMRDCAIPALKKLYPELLTTPEENLEAGTMAVVPVVLASNGYEWQDNDTWKARFEKILAAA